MFPPNLIPAAGGLLTKGAAVASRIPRGDIGFARQLASRVDTNKYINPEQFRILLNIAKQNLNIPKKTFGKMNIQQILQELLGAAETPR